MGGTLNTETYTVNITGAPVQTRVTADIYTRTHAMNADRSPSLFTNFTFGGYVVEQDALANRSVYRERLVTPPTLNVNTWDTSTAVYERCVVEWPRFNVICDEFGDAFVFDVGNDLNSVIPAWFHSMPIRWCSSQGDYGAAWHAGLLSDEPPTDPRAMEWPFRHPVGVYPNTASYDSPSQYYIPHGKLDHRLVIPGQTINPGTGFSIFTDDGEAYSFPCISSWSYGGYAWGPTWWGAAAVPLSIKGYFTRSDVNADQPFDLTVTCVGEDVQGNTQVIQTFTVTTTLDAYSGGLSAQHYVGTFTLTNPIPNDVVMLIWYWGCDDFSVEYGTQASETLVPYVPGVPTGATSRHITGDRLPSAWLLKVT